MHIAIIPARSGSKGIPHKNKKIFIDKPLLAHAITQARESKLFKSVVVSTDSEEYREIATQYGAEVLIRPQNLVGDEVPLSEVSLHTLHQLHAQNRDFDSFAVLQPTSPLRSVQDIQKSYALLQEKSADAIISVTATAHPEAWYNTLPADCSMRNFIAQEKRNKQRQSLDAYYCINGAIFWAKIRSYLINQDVYKAETFAYVMPPERSVDIDSEYDFALAEFLYQRNIVRSNTRA